MGELERELQRGLRSVAAPAGLWDRVKSAQVPSQMAPPRRTNQALVWTMAAAVVLIAMGLSSLYRESGASDEALALQALSVDSQQIAFRCQSPAQIRAWVRAKTGLDLPLRAEPSPSIQLIGAQTIGGTRGVEVAYRAGHRDAILLVSRASGVADVPHRHSNGNVSSWVMAGQRYTLASNDAAELQLACKLCHLD